MEGCVRGDAEVDQFRVDRMLGLLLQGLRHTGE